MNNDTFNIAKFFGSDLYITEPFNGEEKYFLQTLQNQANNIIRIITNLQFCKLVHFVNSSTIYHLF